MADKDIKYKQLFAPDSGKLAILLDVAKGPSRTMAEFVADCKGKSGIRSVSTPTFSRIKRGMLTRPVSDELIKVIAKHSANPDIANLDSLMRANGKVREEEYVQNMELRNAGFGEGRSRYSAICEYIEGIVVYNLIQSGHAISKVNYETAKKLSPDYYEEILEDSDWTYRVQGEEPVFWNYILADAYYSWMSAKDPKLGAIDKKSFGFNIEDNAATVEKAAETFTIKQFMQDYYPLFIRDAWKPEIMKDVRTTFVFISKVSYDKAKEFLSEGRFNSEIAIMLVDIVNRKIEKQEFIKK